MCKEKNDFEWYLVFCDSNGTQVISYGYQQRPAIIDIKYAFDQLTNEPDLLEAIPNWKQQVDYVSVDIMTHKSFVKYMIKQEKQAKKLEKKSKKKKGK